MSFESIDREFREAQLALGIACWHLAPILERERQQMHAAWTAAAEVMQGIFTQNFTQLPSDVSDSRSK